MPCGDQPPQRVGEVGARRIENGQVIEPGRAWRRRRAAGALPGVETDVVMVAAGGNERRLGAVALGELETQHAAIESERPIEVGHLEVDMTDFGFGRYRPRCCAHRTALLL